ncbi:MAG: hypothetical protein A2020_12335 [Lentisphaerae bacterium GWF2_45_14]|nr:MAG: hypothetical protein A2020_12335 [Lentisphaerae bacterium GWF2_45_14]
MPPTAKTSTTTAVAKRVATADLPVVSMDDLRVLGLAIAQSGMFGVKTEGAGIVLAATCIQEKMSFLEFKKTYHIIEGSPSMRADAILADFCSKYDGEYDIIERTPERVEIKLICAGKEFSAAFTWKEAQDEEYCYGKDGKTLKNNWSTPRRRMQMLWARLVSDSVRAFCPQVVKGTYTPEEISDFSDSPRQEKPVETAIDITAAQERMNQAAGKPEPKIKDAEIVPDVPAQDTPVTPPTQPPAVQPAAEPDYNHCPDSLNLPEKLRGKLWSEANDKTLQSAMSAIMAGKYPELTPKHGEVIQVILNERAAAANNTETNNQ